MVPLPPAAIPKRGDMVVTPTNDGSHRYALGTFGEAPQLVCPTQQEAMAQADRFARTHHLDVWQTDDGRTFTRISKARSGRTRGQASNEA
jgi:hypothetical protein